MSTNYINSKGCNDKSKFTTMGAKDYAHLESQTCYINKFY